MRTIKSWIAGCIAGLLCASVVAVEKPNVVIVFTDDQGYQDLGCFGSPTIKTPNIDRMASEGRRFTNFYVSSSICSPSRASLMTGCYAKRVGMQDGVVHPQENYGLHPEETTLAEMFKVAGYSTGLVGKWHLGHTSELLPMKQGFDSFYGSPYSNDMRLSPFLKLSDQITFRLGRTREDMYEKRKGFEDCGVLMRGDEVIEFPADQAQWTQRYTKEALEFIRLQKDSPFFLYMAYSLPHLPVAASSAFEGKSSYGPYGDTIEEIDWSVGEIIKALRGVERKTLVIYTSDNGPWNLMAKGDRVNHVGCALPLREGKSMPWEGGLRVPTVMWGPGIVPPGTVCDELATTMDLFPTLAHMAGGILPESRKLDGVDITNLVTQEPSGKSERKTLLYYSSAGDIVGLRNGNWKLLMHNEETIKKHKKTNQGREPDTVELFDLDADISEANNLVDKYPEIAESMKKQMVTMDLEIQQNVRPCLGIVP